MDELYITLFGATGEELSYKVECIFEVDGTEQLYCGAVPVSGGDIIFLRCALTEYGETTDVTVEDIPNTAEYARVKAAYLSGATQEAIDDAREELSAADDYITVTDANGNEIDFILHTIFEDETSKRSYIAVQGVEKDGTVHEEISLYRYIEDGDTASIDMISSDMEYERAKKLFTNFIENT